MAYTPQTWANLPSETTPISAARLQHIEDGIAELGTWTSYTPTLANMTLGDGTLTASWSQIGKTVNALIMFTLGSTSAVGTLPTFTVPIPAFDSNSYFGIQVRIVGAGTTYLGGANYTTTTVQPRPILTNATYGTQTTATATVPFTWASGDSIRIGVSYRAA